MFCNNKAFPLCGFSCGQLNHDIFENLFYIFFTRVSSHVSEWVTTLTKTFSTCNTKIWLLTCVGSRVDSQSTIMTESFFRRCCRKMGSHLCGFSHVYSTQTCTERIFRKWYILKTFYLCQSSERRPLFQCGHFYHKQLERNQSPLFSTSCSSSRLVQSSSRSSLICGGPDCSCSRLECLSWLQSCSSSITSSTLQSCCGGRSGGTKEHKKIRHSWENIWHFTG